MIRSSSSSIASDHRACDVEKIHRLEAEVRLSDDLFLGGPADRVAPFDPAADLRGIGRIVESHWLTGASACARGLLSTGTGEAARGIELDAHAMGQRDSASRSAHELGFGREAPLRISIERRADRSVIPEHRLMHALGKREIGKRIMRFEQAVDFEIDCRALCPARRREAEARKDIAGSPAGARAR